MYIFIKIQIPFEDRKECALYRAVARMLEMYCVIKFLSLLLSTSLLRLRYLADKMR